ncbi:uncharacterized protein LOC144145190 isoform X2 [Haemaphysalis longicornis]
MLQVFGLIRSRIRSPCFSIRVLGTSFAPASRRALREMLHAPVVAGYATTCNGGKSTGTGPPSSAGEQSLEESYRRCFVGDRLSTQYKEARPTIPPGMVAEIVEYANKTIRCQDGLCVDVGCGPGQSTERFSPYFKAVLGTDISETQIDIARATCTASNVTFQVSKAESLPVEDGSVALVSTVNALHWFHKDAFFAEVRRVLADGGVFCPALYRLRAVAEPGLEDCLEEFRTDEFKGYTTPQHDFWTYGYDYTEVPFDDAQKGKSTGTGPPSSASEQSLEDSYRRCYVGDRLSAQYKEARPAITPGMVAEIVQYANKTIRCQDGLCVDVGCGPGQSTERFSPYFKAVLGTDISETQIDIARATCTASNVTFQVSEAESLPVEDGSVALVSTVNALHWFHWDAFFAEVRRVLADGGVFCPALYWLRAVAEPGLEDCLEEFLAEEFKGYTTRQHDVWTYGYDYTEVPFDDAQKRDFVVKEKTTLSAFMSLAETWSFVILKKEKEPEEAAKALETLSSRIRSKLGKSAEDDPTLQVAYRASYILCRK